MSQAIIIDLNSDSVGASGEGISPIRRRVSFQINQNLERLLDDLTGSLKQVLDTVATNKSVAHHPSSLECFLAAPFHTSQTKRLTLTKGKPFTFTHELAKKLVAEEAKRVVGNNNQGLTTRLMRATVNGYETSLEKPMIGERLELDAYFSLASDLMLTHFRDILRSYFGRAIINFYPFCYSLYALAQTLFGVGGKQALIVNIESEITELVIVEHGVLIETISFPVGHSQFIRSYLTAYDTVPGEAESSLELYSSGKLSTVESAKIETVITQTTKEWQAACHESLEQTLDHFLLARDVYVVTDSPFASLFVQALTTFDSSSFVISHQPFDVHLISDKIITGDARLGIEKIFYDTLIKSSKH